jgi:cysteinyl-tRNA synthetase
MNRPSKKKTVFVKQIETLRKEFLKAMENDVNTPLALTHFFEVISLVNKQIDQDSFSKDDLEAARKTILELGEFFQIIPEIKEEKLPIEVEKLIQEREEARKKKDWKKADEIREKIRELGYALEDTVEGIRWKKLN